MGLLQDWGKKASDWAKEKGGQLSEGWKSAGGAISRAWKSLPPEWKIVIVVTALAVGFWFLAPVIGATFSFSFYVGSVAVLQVTATTAAVTFELLGITYAIHIAQQNKEVEEKDTDRDHKRSGEQERPEGRQQPAQSQTDRKGTSEKDKDQLTVPTSRETHLPTSPPGTSSQDPGPGINPDPDDPTDAIDTFDPAASDTLPKAPSPTGQVPDVSNTLDTTPKRAQAGSPPIGESAERPGLEQIPVDQPYFTPTTTASQYSPPVPTLREEEPQRTPESRPEKDYYGRDPADPKAPLPSDLARGGYEPGGLSVSIFGGTAGTPPAFEGRQPLFPQPERTIPLVPTSASRPTSPASLSTPIARTEKMEPAEIVRQPDGGLQPTREAYLPGRARPGVPTQSSSFTTLDVVHTALGLGSLVPAYGLGFAVADAALYAIEGKYASAGIALAAGVPVLGGLTKVSRVGEGIALAERELIELLRRVDYAEIKSIKSIAAGFRQLSERAVEQPGATSALFTYTPKGELFVNVFEEGAEISTEIFRGRVGQIAEEKIIQSGLRPGTRPFGDFMEGEVKDYLERLTGQEFMSKLPNAGGIDLVPLR